MRQSPFWDDEQPERDAVALIGFAFITLVMLACSIMALINHEWAHLAIYLIFIIVCGGFSRHLWRECYKHYRTECERKARSTTPAN